MGYVGVDLHRKRSHVVALDPTGEVVLSRRIGNVNAKVGWLRQDAHDAKTQAEGFH